MWADLAEVRAGSISLALWESVKTGLKFLPAAAFNVLAQWHGFQPNASGFVPLSIAEFSL